MKEDRGGMMTVVGGDITTIVLCIDRAGRQFVLSVYVQSLPSFLLQQHVFCHATTAY